MKKSNLFIILIVVILGILIYYQGSLTKEKITSSTIKATGSVIKEIEKETEKTEESPIIKEIIEEKEPVIEEKFPKTFLTEAMCINGKEITFTLNNILKKKIETSKLTFYAAGYTLRNPVCDKPWLNPEESSNCKLSLRIKLNKLIKFTIAYPGNSQSVNIDCGR